jgi:multidrug resistance efflux pump
MRRRWRATAGSANSVCASRALSVSNRFWKCSVATQRRTRADARHKCAPRRDASAADRGKRAAREQVSAANAALEVSKVQLSRTRILAPVSGVVMTRNVNPGDIIGANVTSPTLFKIVDPARVEVRMEVEELMSADIAPGLAVKFMLPGGEAPVGTGQVSRVAPQVEKRSIGADDARIRADSMIRPAWGGFVPVTGNALPPINYRLEAWIELRR